MKDVKSIDPFDPTAILLGYFEDVVICLHEK